jgi:hypothetical protein
MTANHDSFLTIAATPMRRCWAAEKAVLIVPSGVLLTV